jgi:hypothetical protein
MEVAGVAVGEVAGEREVDGQVQRQDALGELRVLGIAVEDAAGRGEPVLEDVQHVLPGLPVCG